ncbi:hypothetical protein HTZ84_04985 [Haloterrigena sp. SYSU A558-1]|uniref:Uncharacterized protein n=1 Tax=Haloterrigena gelatinilytica TaxID=2741724 RepID=A0ABX2LG19_9EURY|nr:hypothetical protein [Haloterrigena gelatinilytica]NUC71671.1 hypothetical protein [Haloterrigena gelatinilytica]
MTNIEKLEAEELNKTNNRLEEIAQEHAELQAALPHIIQETIQSLSEEEIQRIRNDSTNKVVSGEVAQIIPPAKQTKYFIEELATDTSMKNFISGKYMIVIWPDGKPSLLDQYLPFGEVNSHLVVSDSVWFAEGEEVGLVVEDTGYKFGNEDSLYEVTETPGDSDE